MADEADIANKTADEWLNQQINAVRAEIPKGYAGVCKECYEHSPRLVNGACAPCRDKYNLG